MDFTPISHLVVSLGRTNGIRNASRVTLPRSNEIADDAFPGQASALVLEMSQAQPQSGWPRVCTHEEAAATRAELE